MKARLTKLIKSERKDDVITFEELGVDRLYVDEAHNYKNLFLYYCMKGSESQSKKSSLWGKF